MHGIRESASFHGGMVTTLEVSPAVVVLNETDTVTSKLKFQNFSLRCDKSDPQISFQTPWNWEIEQGKKIAVIASSSFLRYQLIAGLAGLVPPVSGEIVGHSAIGWPVGGQGGLDSKLRISHALNFLSTVYSDCLEKSESAWTSFGACCQAWRFTPVISSRNYQEVKEISSTWHCQFFSHSTVT